MPTAGVTPTFTGITTLQNTFPKTLLGDKGRFWVQRRSGAQPARAALHGPVRRAGGMRGHAGHDGFASARLQAGRGQLPAGLSPGARDGVRRGEGCAMLGSFSGGRGGQGGQPAPSHLPAHHRRASRRQRADADSSCFEQPRTRVKREINSQSQNSSGVLESFEATQAHAGGYLRSAPTELCPDRAVPGGDPSHGPCGGDPSPHKRTPWPCRGSGPHNSVLAYLGIRDHLRSALSFPGGLMSVHQIEKD